MMNTQTPNQTIVLYDVALGGTPDTQGKLAFRCSPGAVATQSFADGATTLDSMGEQTDSAGYFADLRSIPALDRQRGFALSFCVQLVEEYHADSDKDGDGVGDRAGFSVIALSSDAMASSWASGRTRCGRRSKALPSRRLGHSSPMPRARPSTPPAA